MNISDLLNTTVAQAIAWLVSFGIGAAVAYGLGFLPVSDAVRNVIQVVVSAMLVAGVTALSTFIPDSWLALKLVDAAFLLVSLIVAQFGAAQFGALKSMAHKIDAVEFRARLTQ